MSATDLIFTPIGCQRSELCSNLCSGDRFWPFYNFQFFGGRGNLYFGQKSVRLQPITTGPWGIESPRCPRLADMGPGARGGQNGPNSGKTFFYPPPYGDLFLGDLFLRGGVYF